MDLGFGPEKLNFPGYEDVSGGSLLKNLEIAGVKPEDITDVFYTHLHMDHTGWTSIKKNGKFELTFPKANHWCSKEEWDYWIKTDAPFGNNAITDFFKKSVLEPLTNVIKFAKDKQEMAPHLTAHLVPGHTPGLIILKLELDGKILWFCSDIFHSVVQITERSWYTVYDIDPKAAEITRKRMIKEFIKNNAFICDGHFTYSAFGKITGKEDNLKWIPCMTRDCDFNSDIFNVQEDL